MTRKSRPRSACRMCKAYKYQGNAHKGRTGNDRYDRRHHVRTAPTIDGPF